MTARRIVARTHDDCDGDRTQALLLLEGPDGDIHIGLVNPPLSGFLRFRMPMIGGGMSEHTWEALRNLMDAMTKDNAERPTMDPRGDDHG